MGAISSLYIRIKGDASHFESTLHGVERSLKRSGTQLKRAGMDLTKGLTVPILGAGAAIVAFGENWDALVEKVKTISPTVAAEMEEIGNSIRKALKGAIEWFEKLDPRLRDFIVKAALITAALGPVIYAIGTGARALAALIGIVSKLGPAVAIAKVAVQGLVGWLGTAGLAGALTTLGPILAGAGAAVTLYKLILEGMRETAEATVEQNRQLRDSYKDLGDSLKNIVDERAKVGAHGGEGLFIGPKAEEYSAAARELEGYVSTCENLLNRLKYEWDDLDVALAEKSFDDMLPHGARGGTRDWMDSEFVKPVKEIALTVHEKVSTMMDDFAYLRESGIYAVSDAIADLAVDGTINFREFARSLQREMIAVITRALLLRTVLRSIGWYTTTTGTVGGVGTTGAETGSPGGGAYIVQGFAPSAGGGAGERVNVVINNHGLPIEGQVSASTATSPTGEKTVYLTILGNVRKALRSGALSQEMALYGGRRVGTV